jgi:hypothetical protein
VTEPSSPSHFQGKTVSQHLKDARLRGARAQGEVHGTELPGHISAGADNAKTTSVLLLLLYTLGALPSFSLLLIAGWILWSTGRSALLGWTRLERLHRVIEEERYEIEHHREQEKQELREMYADKGFSGKLLDEVVDVLMSDDNRLLKIMLEEELGLSLEAFEHPLKQASGAAVGALIACAFPFATLLLPFAYGIPIANLLVIMVGSYITAKYEKRRVLESVIWNFSLALFAAGIVYFLMKIV